MTKKTIATVTFTIPCDILSDDYVYSEVSLTVKTDGYGFYKVVSKTYNCFEDLKYGVFCCPTPNKCCFIYHGSNIDIALLEFVGGIRDLACTYGSEFVDYEFNIKNYNRFLEEQLTRFIDLDTGTIIVC